MYMEMTIQIYVSIHTYTNICTLSSWTCTYICKYTNTAYCIWSVIFAFSNLNRWSNSLGLLYHVPLKRHQRDGNWRLRLNDTPSAIRCICKYTDICTSHVHQAHVYVCIYVSIYTHANICTRIYVSIHTIHLHEFDTSWCSFINLM